MTNKSKLDRSQWATIARISAMIAIVGVLGGCALSKTNQTNYNSVDKIVTNSVSSEVQKQGVAETDTEIIKQAVAQAPATGAIQPLAWANPLTGSTGTIVAIDKFMGKHGQNCRGFKTSFDSFMGISFYDGEACQISPGEWVLSWFRASS